MAETTLSTEQDPRWQAVLQKDACFDGAFVYSVASTGVYCRPSCAARRPLPINVRFHADGEAARKAGFRPCKRCHPDDQTSPAQRQAELIGQVCRMIEQAEELPSLEQMAEAVGLSAWHFHRLFKSITGLTPKAYATAHRAEKVRANLSDSSSVTDAFYAAGFNSSSRFYEQSDHLLGMTPGSYRRGGDGATIHYAIGQCNLGTVLVARSERGLCAILIGDQPEALTQDLTRRFPKARLELAEADFQTAVVDVVACIEQPGRSLDLPLDIQGTAFQQRVWQALRDIPVGSTTTYRQLAEQLGAPKSVRAVAGACAANALAVVVPCHRVIRGDGSLAGYRWGLERKRELLKREKSG